MPDFESGLARRAREGDQDSLRALVEQAYPLVRRWALIHVGNPVDADDLTQDVLVMMIRRLDSFQGDALFSTWLYAVTRNAAADRFRKEARRARIAKDPGAYDLLLPSPADDPSKAPERAELRELLRTFFEELPQRQREVFDLVELQGLPAAEVAERLGLEPVSVRAHLFKARKKMRARILVFHPDFAPEAP